MKIKVLSLDEIKKKEILILILCLLIGFALRFYTFDRKSLWLDEIYTFEDSRDGFGDQLKFYKENPTFLHPPLFFILTHQFYPFTNPERDLRVIPLIFGTLSIPMIYFLSRSFSSYIALPCTLSLTLMTYHISLSQDGRMYTFLMFFGMASFFTFMRYLKTGHRIYLFLTAISFSILFLTSYSSILFIGISQIFWLCNPNKSAKKRQLSSFFLLNGVTFSLILPWLVFIGLNYHGKPLMNPIEMESPGSFWRILYGVFHDWTGSLPLIVLTILLFTLFPFIAKDRRKAFILLSMFIAPIGGLYLFCKFLKVPHFVASRYFINFLPLFLITIYTSLESVEIKFTRIRRWFRPSLLFVLLFTVSNAMVLPIYYRSEKMDFRGLATYLKNHLREGDEIFVVTTALMPGILSYLGALPPWRHHKASPIMESGQIVGYEIPFVYRKKTFSLIYSERCCNQWIKEGRRLWMIVFKWKAKDMIGKTPAVLKGYFDGRFLNHDHFPADASMYLFLWDPKSPEEKGIDIPIE